MGSNRFLIIKKYFESGYPFLIDDKGVLVIHPTNEGGSSTTADKIKSHGGGKGIINYEYKGENKILYFENIEKIKIV